MHLSKWILRVQQAVALQLCAAAGDKSFHLTFTLLCYLLTAGDTQSPRQLHHMRACKHTHMHALMHAHTQGHTQTQVHTHTDTQTHSHWLRPYYILHITQQTHIHTHAHGHSLSHKQAQTHTHTRRLTDTHTLTHIKKYTHTHTKTQIKIHTTMQIQINRSIQDATSYIHTHSWILIQKYTKPSTSKVIWLFQVY